MFIGMYRHGRDGMADERKHPRRQSSGRARMHSGARRFVGDGGRSGVNQHDWLVQLSLGHWREGDQLGKFRNGDAVAAGSANAALVGDVGQFLAAVLAGILGLELDFGVMTVLGMIMSALSIDGAQELPVLRGGHLGRSMLRPRPAKQHRRGRHSLQRDRGHDEPSKEKPEAGHDRWILLRLVGRVVKGHVYAHLLRALGARGSNGGAADRRINRINFTFSYQPIDSNVVF